MAKFIHLRVRTEFSLRDSIVRVKSLVKRLAEQAQPACGISDLHNFFGLIKFYKACEGTAIKPICGCDLLIRSADDEPSLLTLFAMDEQGYKNITKLISRSFQEGQVHGEPFIERDWLTEHNQGVLALSGAKFGDVGRLSLSGKSDEAAELVTWYQHCFANNYYLELQRTDRDQDAEHIAATVLLAAKTQCPVVATNDVRFIDSDGFEAHEARVCIGEGRALDDPRRKRRYSDQQYLKTEEQMCVLFEDIPEALENAVEIAKRCSLDIELGKYYLPEYPIPQGMTENDFLRKICFEGLDQRLAKILKGFAKDDAEARRAEFIKRLEFELDIITQMGFPGYFLIVMDFIRWAKQNQIPVGPGRGSGAGSLVAYVLEITDLDPLEYDLLFERFLNPERVSMPDFDVDFCMDDRDKVINYVAETYGRQAVSQIITFGTMAAKAVVRDVARVQGKSYGLADKLSKMIPPDVGMTLQKAFDGEEVIREFLQADSEAQEIWDMALMLEGITRNVGKHAGGVVIAPTSLTDFSPLYCDETGAGLVTQFDKNDVEDAGLVKFDFLGLRTLTIIDHAVKMINAERRLTDETALNIEDIPLDDKATFDMVKRAETTAVFQLESRGMKDLILRLKPDSLEEMIALVALFRPGPLQSGMVDDFINRKHGRAKVAYPDATYQHESLKPILEPTYGVIVYQEQVMQIAQVLAGYSLGGADLLRRAMGKKKPEEMAKQRAVFEQGAAEQGIDPLLAMKIFDLVEKFAGYGFNKSHSAAYALVSYQTAWLKAHYPAHFMAATISSDMDKTDKVVTFIEECRAMKLTLLPPDVNSGEFQFTVNPSGQIIYGLGAIKGLGEGPVETILSARAKGGPFSDLFDFCARVVGGKVNKRAIEALIKSGAMDHLGPGVDLDYDRAVMSAAVNEAIKAADQISGNAAAGMVDLFGSVIPEEDDLTEVYKDFAAIRRYSRMERLEGENNTLGLYLTGHPIDEYEDDLTRLVSARLRNLKPVPKKSQKVAGQVVAFRVMKTKRGDNMAFVTLDDRTGRLEVAVFSDTYNENRDRIVKDAMLLIEGQVSSDDYNGGIKMRADKVASLTDARLSAMTTIGLAWSKQTVPQDCVKQLKSIIKGSLAPLKESDDEMPDTFTARCAIQIQYQTDNAAALIELGKDWEVQPSQELLESLRIAFGSDNVKVGYSRREAARSDLARAS